MPSKKAPQGLTLREILGRLDEGELDFSDIGGLAPEEREENLAGILAHVALPEFEGFEALGFLDPKEYIPEGTPENPRVRVAGTLPGESDNQVTELRRMAETNLYIFAKVILNKWFLYPPFHAPLTAWLTDFRTHRRKLSLWPRAHGKTTIVCHTLPLHIFIQPKASNLYFPDTRGTDARVIIACETLVRAKDHVRVLQEELEGNTLLRSLWPESVWPGKASKHAKLWNAESFILPRATEWPDPSCRGLGTGAALAGSHANVMIKDDLISFNAACSITEMTTAIEWHEASRAVLRGQLHLEFIIGTRWSVSDIYSHILDDPTVAATTRAAIEEGQVVYPPVGRKEDGSQVGFTLEDLRAEQQKNPTLFALNYMNDATDVALVDFPRDKLRFFELQAGPEGREILFEEDERDIQLASAAAQLSTPLADAASQFMRGVPFTPQVQRAFRESLAGARVRWR